MIRTVLMQPDVNQSIHLMDKIHRTRKTIRPAYICHGKSTLRGKISQLEHSPCGLEGKNSLAQRTRDINIHDASAQNKRLNKACIKTP